MLGTSLAATVIQLTPLEKPETLTTKLLKRCKIDVRDAQHHIIEGDVVILTTFF
jgi:hypothetical protein